MQAGHHPVGEDSLIQGKHLVNQERDKAKQKVLTTTPEKNYLRVAGRLGPATKIRKGYCQLQLRTDKGVLANAVRLGGEKKSRFNDRWEKLPAFT